MYGFLSLAAEVGGYVGLFLGVSFFHLAVFVKNETEKRLLGPMQAGAKMIKQAMY